MVERGPEKAGVGGSIPSLATITGIHFACRALEAVSDWHSAGSRLAKGGHEMMDNFGAY